MNKVDKTLNLYKIYSMFSHDILFFYGVSFLFYTEVKQIDIALITVISSLFPLFRIVLQIPASIVVEKLGNKRGIIFSNIFIFVCVLIYILGPGYMSIIIGDIFYAFGLCMKSISEGTWFYNYLKVSNQSLYKINEIGGKSMSKYHFMDAITCLLSGVLFSINPYLPVVLSLLFWLIPTVLAFKLENIKVEKDEDYITPKENIELLKTDIKKILNSRRLISIFLFALLFTGAIRLQKNYSNVFMSHLEFSPEIFGIVYAICTIVQGIAAHSQKKIENINKRKTLTIISVPFISSFVILGLLSLFKINNILITLVLFFTFFTNSISKGTYHIYMSRYLSNFSNIKIRPKILTIYNLLSNIGGFVIAFIGGLMLKGVSVDLSYIAMGTTLLILLIFVLNYMKKHFGLNKKEYENRDIVLQ
jgi:MFS family permease